MIPENKWNGKYLKGESHAPHLHIKNLAVDQQSPMPQGSHLMVTALLLLADPLLPRRSCELNWASIKPPSSTSKRTIDYKLETWKVSLPARSPGIFTLEDLGSYPSR